MSNGLRIPRRYTTEGHDAYEAIAWQKRDSRIPIPMDLSSSR